MNDISDLRWTIVPKSDQLNGDQLVAGPIDVTITSIQTVASKEQPMIVHYEGEEGRPYKPCLTMRRVLMFAWGQDGNLWIGRKLRLFRDPVVRFGTEEVGGIRISHMSDIAGRIKLSLSASKGKKVLYTVDKLEEDKSMTHAQIADWVQSIEAAAADELDAIKASALEAAKAVQDREAFAKFSSAAKKRRAELAQ